MLDPFIAHAMHELVCEKYQRVAAIDESLLVESVCYHHYQGKYPSYYIKTYGEVDISYMVKWISPILTKNGFFRLRSNGATSFGSRRGPRGCVIEVFNALGESVAVVTVPENAVEALRADEVLAVRPRAVA